MLKYGDALVTMALETKKGEERKEQIRENLQKLWIFFEMRLTKGIWIDYAKRYVGYI